MLAGSITAHRRVQIWRQALLDALVRERTRAPLWIPVLIGAGALAYFAMPWRMQWMAALLLCVGASAGALALLPAGWRGLSVAPLLVALGLGSAWMRAESVNTPTLRQQIVNATVEGRVRSFEPRAQGGSRFVLGDVRIRAGTGLLHLRLVRITARGEGIALRPGQAVRVRAWLQPPRLPLTPDGYDAARRAWFEGVGATGIAMGPIAVLQPPLARTSLWQLLEELRQRLGVRIRDRIPGAPGAVAAALVTGERAPIPAWVETAMRNSGLTHLLSISGLHIAVVAGLAFLTVRKTLLLNPWVGLHWPVKAIAILASAIAALAYTLLSGASWPTVRACLATLVVLLGTLAGRQAISLRVIAAAATLILVLRPEAVVNPSFQLSFAAVTALVAASQSRIAQRWLSRRPEDGTLQHLLRAAGLLILTGLAVEAMLAPIVIRHFNQTSLYGVAANLFAIPFTGMVIMPTLGVALLLEPLGLAMPFWRLCEAAILALLRLADWVSQLPGAVIHLPTPPLGAATLLVFALFWAILWRSRVRILAAVMVVIALSAMAMARRPVGFVDGEGRVVGVWRADGDLMVSSVRSGRYASTLWAEDLAARRIVWLGDASRDCSAEWCRITLPGRAAGRGWVLLHVRAFLSRSHLQPLCADADWVVAARRLPRWCRPRLQRLDLPALQGKGGILFLDAGARGLRIEAAVKPSEYPWRRMITPHAALRPPQ